MHGEEDNESEEDKRLDEFLFKYLKNVGLEHVDMILKASIETQESNGFETKQFCVCTGYVGHEDG